MHKSDQRVLISEELQLLQSEGNENLNFEVPFWGYLEEVLLDFNNETTWDQEGYLLLLLDNGGIRQTHVLGTTTVSEDSPIQAKDDQFTVQYYPQRPIILPLNMDFQYYRRLHKKIHPDHNFTVYTRVEEIEPSVSFSAGETKITFTGVINISCKGSHR